VATAAEDRLNVSHNPHTSFARPAIAEQARFMSTRLSCRVGFPRKGGCETRWGSVRLHKPRLDLYGRQHGEWDGRMQFMASSKTKHKHCLT
jgi:hypothetical protein